MAGIVRGLFITPQEKAKPIAVDAIGTSEHGFHGDYPSKFTSGRQILMSSQQTLNELHLEPGSTSENVVIDGIDVMSLTEGQQLRMGEAILEVTVPCEPCAQMDRIRPGLKSALGNRRGMFATVVAAGIIRVGDAVEVDRINREEGARGVSKTC